MLYLCDAPPGPGAAGSFRVVVLDAEDLEAIRHGFALGEPRDTALITYTPDVDWLGARTAAEGRDLEAIVRLIAQSQRRPERRTVEPIGCHYWEECAREPAGAEAAAEAVPTVPPADDPPRLRRPDAEVQRAHDVLWSQHTGAAPFMLDESARPLVAAALDVLCWVLGHHHADGFTRSLADIERGLLVAGYVLEEIPR
jgi:hypothetical protein